MCRRLEHGAALFQTRGSRTEVGTSIVTSGWLWRNGTGKPRAKLVFMEVWGIISLRTSWGKPQCAVAVAWNMRKKTSMEILETPLEKKSYLWGWLNAEQTAQRACCISITGDIWNLMGQGTEKPTWVEPGTGWLDWMMHGGPFQL